MHVLACFIISLVCTLISAGKCRRQQFSKFNNNKKRCGIFSELTRKTPKERQCFLMTPCQWGCFGGYSCTWICFKVYLSIIYFIWCMAGYTMRQTCVPLNITRSTKLRGMQCSPEIAFRSTDFCVPENLNFPALKVNINI